MTQIARLYGGSMYDLAAQEQLTDTVMEQMQVIRQLFRENPDYVKLLSEPSIPKEERTKLLDEAFGKEAERYLVNFLKLLCERGILGEYGGCCEEFTRRYNMDHNIATAVVTSAVTLTDEQMAALKDKLEKISGKTVTLTQKTDPTKVKQLRSYLLPIQVPAPNTNLPEPLLYYKRLQFHTWTRNSAPVNVPVLPVRKKPPCDNMAGMFHSDRILSSDR